MKTKLKEMKKLIFLALASLMLGVYFLGAPAPAQAANCSKPSEGIAGVSFLQFDRAIVPCGRSCDDIRTVGLDETGSCTLCHLLIMAKNIFDLMFAWIIILALISLTIGGVVYIVSVGNPGTTSLAKGIITKTLMGFAGFLLAWLLVYTILTFLSAKDSALGINSGGHWYEFNCSTESAFDEEVATPPTTGSGAGTGMGPGASAGDGVISAEEQAKRDMLWNDHGIEVSESAPGATKVNRLHTTSINGIIAFKNESGLPIVITGAGETGGPHVGGEAHVFTHGNGYKVDIRITPEVTNYIIDNYTPAGVRSDGAAMYKDSGGNLYAKEGNHWDICYACWSGGNN